MAILTPCSPTLVSANQVTAGTLGNVSMAAADFMVNPSASQTVQVHAPGMVNVEVWTHGAMAARLTNNGMDTFTGTINTSLENNGPVHTRILAWNSAPGNNNFTVHLWASFDFYIRTNGSNLYTPPMPTAAAGMTLKWKEAFNSPTYVLSATPCKPGTGIWPNCTPPTASDGFTWFENKTQSCTPGTRCGVDFGNAAWEHTDGPYNPFAIFQGGTTQASGGYLRTRLTYDPNYVDPYGFHRNWRTGGLSTAFPDGSYSTPTFAEGYYEARILLPDGATSDGSVPNSGGTFPAFWMLTTQGILASSSNVEEDIMEANGPFPYDYAATQHVYGSATGPNSTIYHGIPGPDLTWGFHRFGLLVTATMVSAYYDDQLMGSVAKGLMPGNVDPIWFVMIDAANGSGWPINPPPAGYFDMWVNYVSYYAP
jgi:hypothetical protein